MEIAKTPQSEPREAVQSGWGHRTEESRGKGGGEGKDKQAPILSPEMPWQATQG